MRLLPQQFLKCASGTGTSLTAYYYDWRIGSAYIAPVGNLTAVNLSQLILGQILYCIGRVNYNCDAIDCYDILYNTIGLLIIR